MQFLHWNSQILDTQNFFPFYHTMTNEETAQECWVFSRIEYQKVVNFTCCPYEKAIKFLICGGQLILKCYGYPDEPRLLGFPDSSVGKKSAFNAGDPSSTPGSGRSTGEGIGYPLQHSWASIVAQLVKKPHAMWETWVQSLGWEDSLEKRKATHSCILAWRIPWTVLSIGSQRVRNNWATLITTSWLS